MASTWEWLLVKWQPSELHAQLAHMKRHVSNSQSPEIESPPDCPLCLLSAHSPSRLCLQHHREMCQHINTYTMLHRTAAGARTGNCAARKGGPCHSKQAQRLCLLHLVLKMMHPMLGRRQFWMLHLKHPMLAVPRAGDHLPERRSACAPGSPQCPQRPGSAAERHAKVMRDSGANKRQDWVRTTL